MSFKLEFEVFRVSKIQQLLSHQRRESKLFRIAYVLNKYSEETLLPVSMAKRILKEQSLPRGALRQFTMGWRSKAQVPTLASLRCCRLRNLL